MFSTRCRSGLVVALLPALLVAVMLLTACDVELITGPPTPTSTPPPEQVLRPAPTPTAPPTGTPSPVPTRTPVPTPTPFDLATALGVPPLETLLERSSSLKEYTFNYRIMPDPSGPILMSGKAFVKDTKIRQELFVQGQRAVILGDSKRQLYHVLFSDQKMAIRLDLKDVGNQAVNPSESVLNLTNNSHLINGEIMHGQASAVYEMNTPEATLKYWVWIEKGLPLRIQAIADEGEAVLDFSDYHFGTQPDMLFELPPGTNIVEAATNQPKLPNTGPSLPTPSRTY